MATGVRIKGSVLLSRLSFIDQHAGVGGRTRVLSRLTPGERTTLDGALASAWYPFELNARLDAAIVQTLGGGSHDFFRRLGADSAERNLSGVHRGFVVKGDPQAFLAQAPDIYAFYYDRGHRTYERMGPKEAVLTTYEAETFSIPDCLTIVGWHTRALEICGATGVKMVEEECRARGAPVCRYRIAWD